MDSGKKRWLLLIHQIPPKPNYFRVKIWRQLQRLGAVAIKNSVYALPRSDQTYEDFQWVLRAIVDGGGEASLCEARFAEGLDDGQIEALFHAARDADYAQIADEAARVSEGWPVGILQNDERARLEVDVARLRRRLNDVAAIDFFSAPGGEVVDASVSGLEARLRLPPAIETAPKTASPVRGRTWVTRKGIHVDRMASAWLIRRFIDPDATFKFVAAQGYRPEAGELRFDMFDAEFTHEGDSCTFEVLLTRFGLEQAALRALGEIVHDIDLKETKYARPETQGVASLVVGIAFSHRDDEARLARASAMFDDLHEYFSKKERGKSA